MKVGDLISELKKYPGHLDVQCFTPCGPAKVERIFLDSMGAITIDTGYACDHIMDGQCRECEETHGAIWSDGETVIIRADHRKRRGGTAPNRALR